MQPFYREQHGFIELGCVKQPCLFTWPVGEDIAQVPAILADAIATGGTILFLVARTHDGLPVRSYVFAADRRFNAALCMYPAVDQELTGESNRRSCDFLKGAF